MFRCGCCVGPETTIADLLRLLGTERPYEAPPAAPGVTYTPMPFDNFRQRYAGLPGIVKLTQQGLAWWASLARASYYPDSSFIHKFASALKPDFTLTFVPNGTGLVPGYAVLEWSDGIIVVVSGTSNVSQSLAYIATHVAVMNTGTPFVANAAWYDAAVAIKAAISDNHDWLNKMAIFVGHSYGAAVAGLLQSLLPGPEDPFNNRLLVTFGSPAFGTSSFCAFPGNTAGHCRLVNLGDPIPYLPTWTNWQRVGPNTITAVQAQDTYRHCGTPVILDGNRLSTATVQTQSPGGDLFALGTILNGALTRTSVHSIVQYTEGLLSLDRDSIRQDVLENWADWPSVGLNNLRLFNLGY